MAASVSYRINGKYDGKAVTQAQGGMSQLTSSAKALKGALGGIAAGVSVAALVSQFKECTKTFKENNTAQTQMFQALSHNTKVAEDSVKGLVKEFNDMSGLFSGDSLVKGGSFLARMGLDETQMRATAKAAKDLASSGLMSLDQAFDALGKSYNGNITGLKKLFPELQKLTKEELEAGKAVSILGQKFAGMEDAMSNTFEGQITILKDKIDGIKDTIGTLGGFFMQESFKDISTLIDKVQHVADNLMPSIAAWASTLVHTFANFDIAKIFDPKTTFEAWKNMFQVMAKNFLAIFDFLKAKIGGVWTSTQLNNNKALLEQMKTNYASASRDIANKRRPSDLEVQSLNELKESIAELEASISEQEELMKVKGKSLAELMSEMVYNTGEGIKENLGLLTGDDMVTYYNNVKGNFGNYKNNSFTNGGTGASAGASEDGGESATGKAPLRWQTLYDQMEEEKKIQQLQLEQQKAFLGSFGELGEIIALGLEGSGIGIVFKAVGSFVSELQQKSPAFDKLLNIFQTAAQVIVSPELVTLINAFSGPVLKGLMSMFRVVNDLLGPLFELLTPVFWAIGKAVDFIGRVLETISAFCYNIYVAVYNLVHLRNKKSEKSISAVWDGFNDWDSFSMPGSSVDSAMSSASASYSAQRDIYVTINYSHSYVNGDAREIALNLRNEILSAERLGY